jgi:ferritin-like metal-binding protein YciE
MKLNTLRELYIYSLRELLAAERQMARTLPRMARSASHEDLVSTFEEHLSQTEEQAGRLERILSHYGPVSAPQRSEGMAGMIAECEALMEGDMGREVLDAALVGAAQRIEHYEIASYGTVRTYAEMLSEDEDARILQLSLDEQIEADERLTELAEDTINADAETASAD